MKNRALYALIRKPIIKTALCSLLIGMILCGCAGNTPKTLLDSPDIPNFDLDYPVGEVTTDSLITQSFVSPFSSVTELQLYGATYMRTNSGSVLIRLLDGETAQELYSWTLSAEEMTDNTLITLTPNTPIQTKRQTTLLIEITSPDCTPGNAVTFWTFPEDRIENGVLTIAGFEQYNDLWIQVIGT